MIGIVIPVHGDIGAISSLLISLDNQKGCQFFKVVVIYSGSTHNASRLRSFHSINFGYNLIEVPSSSYWAHSISVGIKKIMLNLECSQILLMNDDIYIDSCLISNFELLSKSGTDKSVYFSPVFDLDSERLLSGTLNVNFSELSISDNFEISTHGSINSDLATGRCIMYPSNFFVDGGKVHSTLFPHHFADIDLSRQAIGFGYSLLCNAQVKILSKNNFSSSIRFKGFFKRFFHIKSPDRLISWFMFWAFYARSIKGINFIQYLSIAFRYSIKKLNYFLF